MAEQIYSEELNEKPSVYYEKLEVALAHKGLLLERRLRRFLQSNEFCVNGKRIFSRTYPISLFHDTFTLNGEPFVFPPDYYIVMNKKRDTLCTNKAGDYERVFDCIPEEYWGNEQNGLLHCIGRLDGNTEGLLILTTNGWYSHQLVAPEKHVSKVYYVELRDKVSLDEQKKYVNAFAEGVELEPVWNAGGFVTKPAVLEWCGEDKAYLTLTEGKFHQVKRMFSFMENEVVYLKRVKIGAFELPLDLKCGEWRLMTEEEILKVFG